MDFDLAKPQLGAIGDYELLEEIGAGGMGRVFRARQRSLGRIVALKTIVSRELAVPAMVKRLRKEAEAAAQLDHPSIVTVYEFGEADGQHFFTMPLVEGESLQSRIRSGPLDNRTAAYIVQRIAEAVAHAHSKGIVHRDLKPGNVLIDLAGQVKVTDFGIARRLNIKDVAEPDPVVASKHRKLHGTVLKLTQQGMVMGTPGFMAPEQAMDAERTGPAADIWALGSVLYACLTGRPPFLGADALETLALTVESAPVTPTVVNPDVDPELADICLRCLRKDPADRYTNAAAVAEALGQWRDGQDAPDAWRERWQSVRRWLYAAEPFMPWIAGLAVQRLANFQEGIFVGCTVAGLSLARRHGSHAGIISVSVLTALFFLVMAPAHLVSTLPVPAAGGILSAAGIAAAIALLAAGLVELNVPKSASVTPLRVAAASLVVSLVGLGFALLIALGSERLRVNQTVSADTLVFLNRYVGRVASWFLAAAMGLAAGALCGRVNLLLDRWGRQPVVVFSLGMTAAAVTAVLAYREFRTPSFPETASFTFLGPSATLTLAEDRVVRWGMGTHLVEGDKRWFAAGGVFWFKHLMLLVPMIVGGAVAGAATRWLAPKEKV